MWIVPEAAIGDLMTEEAAFGAVEAVFGAMASGDALQLPRDPRGDRPCRRALRVQVGASTARR